MLIITNSKNKSGKLSDLLTSPTSPNDGLRNCPKNTFRSRQDRAVDTRAAGDGSSLKSVLAAIGTQQSKGFYSLKMHK